MPTLRRGPLQTSWLGRREDLGLSTPTFTGAGIWRDDLPSGQIETVRRVLTTLVG
jgi:hypothetical protein